MEHTPQPTPDLIQTVLEKLPPVQWAAPFVGMIAAKPAERHLLYESLRDFILAYALANDPENVAQLGIVHQRLDDYEFPDGPDKITGSVYVPAACYYNQVLHSPSELEMREILGLQNRSDDLVNRLIAAIVEYGTAIRPAGDTGTFTFECAVHPYVDCLVIPAILYAVQWLLPDDLKLKFKPVPWGELPRRLVESNIHCSYGSQSLHDNLRSRYHFRQIKEESTALVALCHWTDAQRKDYHAYNFPGYYSYKHKTREAGYVSIRRGGKEIDASAVTMASRGDTEALLLLALAFGLLPSGSMIVASTHGLVWAAEAGLLQMQGNCHGIGTLQGSRLDQEPADAFGFLIHAEKDVSGRLWIAGGRLANILDEVKKACEARLLQQVRRSDGVAGEILSVLRVPYMEAFEGDIGFIGRLQPKTLLEMALPGAELFEREADWRPRWWKRLLDDPPADGSPQMQQPLVQDTH